MQLARSRRTACGIARVLLVAASLCVYAQALRFGFVSYDDPVYPQNPQLRDGFTREGVAWALRSFEGGNWNPLTWFSHMLDHELFGEHPAGHHLTSVALHTANALLLFGLLESATGAIAASAFAAALFAVHPMHVESVAWVTERKDVLSACFGLLALGSYVRYARRPSRRGSLLTAWWLALGLMAKPMLVTLPFVFLLLDYWPLGRIGGRAGWRPAWRLLAEKLPLFLLVAAAAAITLVSQRHTGAMDAALIPFAQRLAHAPVAYLAYLARLFWPQQLLPFYPHPYGVGGTPWAGWQVAGAVAALLAISALVVASRRRYAVVGWLWYLGMLLPVIGLVQVGEQGMADRYTYLPSIGLFVAVAWGGAELAAGLRSAALRSAIALAALGLVAAAAWGAWAQARIWRDSASLYTHVLAAGVDHPFLRVNLGALLRAQGRLGEAALQYRRALELDPDDAGAYNNLGNVLREQGRAAEAIEAYREALRIDPDHPLARANLGLALASQGEHREALAELREALRVAPEQASVHRDLADVLFAQELWSDAALHYAEALRLDPGLPGARAGLAAARRRTGEPGAAPTLERTEPRVQ